MNHVLWVEDNADQQLVFDILLEGMAAGDVYDTAVTVPEAIQRIDERQRAGNPYALVVCDLQLPGGTGWDVLDAYLACGHRAEQFLLLSASVEERHRRAAEEAGCGYLVKPSRLEGWQALAARFMDAAPAEASPPRSD